METETAFRKSSLYYTSSGVRAKNASRLENPDTASRLEDLDSASITLPTCKSSSNTLGFDPNRHPTHSANPSLQSSDRGLVNLNSKLSPSYTSGF